MEDTLTYDTQVDQQPDPIPKPKKLSVKDFAAKIKEKYPDYKDVDDKVLTDKIIEKYPVYKDQVDFSEKKNLGGSVGATLGQAGNGPSNGEVSERPNNPLKNQEKIFSGLTKPATDTFELTSTGEPVVSKQRPVRIKTLEELGQEYDKQVPSDQTSINKPLSQIELNDQLIKSKQHKKDVEIAIDNTTKQYFLNKGIKTGTNSQLYQEQKAKVQKAYNEGDVKFHMDLKTNTPRLDKLSGFWPNISKGWNEAMNNNDEAATFVHDMNTEQRVQYVKDKQQEQLNKPPSEYLDERPSGWGGAGQVVGGAGPFMAKAIAGAVTGAGLAAVAPETMGASLAALPVAMSFIYTAPDMANQGGMNETLRRYSMLKQQHPEMNDVEAMKNAESGLLVGGIGGIAENALFMKGMKLPISNEGKQVLGKFATETLQSGMTMGGSTAAVDIAKNLVSDVEGYKTSTKEKIKSAAETFVNNAGAGMLLHGMINGVPKILNSAFKFALKDTPKEEVSNILNANVEAGNITPEQAKKTATDIDGYNEALGKINPKGLSDESQASIAGLIQAKENIKKEAETKDESVRKPYDEKIEAISQQIADIQRTNKPFEHEVDDVTGNTLAKPSFDDVAKIRVQNVADKISKGKEIDDIVDAQTEAKFPDQVETALNKILREEKSANKDKEKPNNEITNNITKYLEKNKKEESGITIEPPMKVPDNIPLEENKISIEPPKEIPEPTTIGNEKENEIPNAEKESSATTPELRETIPDTEETGHPFTEEKRTILSHRGLQEVATEFGLDDVTKRDRKTDPKLFKDAEQTSNDWMEEGKYPEKIEGLVKKAENADVLTDEQRVILQQHVANVRGELSSMDIKDPNYDTRLKELDRLVRAGETTRSAAGAALRVPDMASIPNDLPSMMVEEMRISNTGELTTGQKEKVQKEYNDISEAEKKYQEKISGLEAENAKLRAGKKVSEAKSATTKTKKVHDDFVTERKKITESISDKLKKARGEMNVTPIPYAKELIAIAPDVAKLMKSYVEEGVTKLEDITKKIYDDLKEHIVELKEKDIHDIIAGEYNEKKKTKNQIAATIEDLRIQAKLVTKLDLILKGEEPKNERAKIKRNQEIEKLRNQIKDISAFDKEVSDAKEAKLSLAKKEGKEVDKDLGKAEKELDTADAKETKRKAIEAERERKANLAEAEKERKQLEREFEKEKRDEERAKIKLALDNKRELERRLSYRTPAEYYLDKLKNNLKSQIGKLEEDLRAGRFTTEKTDIKLDKEAQDLKNNLVKLRQDRQLRLMKEEYANRSKRDKAIDTALQILNIPRTIMSSMDYSALLRQSLFSATSHPRTAGLAQLEAFRQSLSQKRFDEWFYDLKDDPRYEMMQKSGLFVADPHDPRLSAKEEAFMNNLAEKIPIAGKMIKGSERAYVGTLNKMRVDLFNRFAERYEAQGKTFENNPDFYKELANYINNSTGRGKLGFMEAAAPVLNSLFFSPRLIASRVNLMTMWANPRFYSKVPKEVRVMYMKDMAKFVGMGMVVLALAKLNGAQVEDDPRSSDFGKIKDGDTRYDIWGGFQPYVRVFSQIATGEKKSTMSGEIKQLNGEQAFGETKSDVLGRFARGKLAPVPSMIWDVLSKRTVTGEKPTLASEAESHLLPLIYSDVKDAYKEQGIKSLFTVGLPAVFGVGINTYGADKKTEKPTKKQKHLKPKKHE